MSAAPAPPPIPALDSTLGAIVIGVIISTALFGVATVQTYGHYKTFPDDHWVLKALVGVVWLCELGHSTSVVHGLYSTTVTRYGDLGALLHPSLGFPLAAVFSALTIPIVQLFMAWRIRKFSRRWAIPVLCAGLATWIFGGGIAVTIIGCTMESLLEYHAKVGWLVITIFICTAVNDLIIAGSLAYALFKTRDNAQTSTLVVVDKLISWSVRTGVITSFFSAAMCVAILASPNTFVWLGIFMFQTKLYSNSFMAILNGRSLLRDLQAKTSVHVGSGLSGFDAGNHSTSSASDRTRVGGTIPINIQMSKVVHKSGKEEEALGAWEPAPRPALEPWEDDQPRHSPQPNRFAV